MLVVSLKFSGKGDGCPRDQSHQAFRAVMCPIMFIYMLCIGIHTNITFNEHLMNIGIGIFPLSNHVMFRIKLHIGIRMVFHGDNTGSSWINNTISG